jgi:phage-related tail protein
MARHVTVCVLRTALVGVGSVLGVLLSPIGLVVAALAGVALVVWKYWQPISAFLGGWWKDSKPLLRLSVRRLSHCACFSVDWRQGPGIVGLVY